jgi:hypothetical protein
MLVLPCVTENIQSRADGSWKHVLAYQELTPEQVGELSKSLRQWMWIALKKDEFKERDLEIMKGINSEFEFSTKPPAQRLRAVFFRMWEQDNEGYKDPELHYRFHMEKVIEHFKGKLP